MIGVSFSRYKKWFGDVLRSDVGTKYETNLAAWVTEKLGQLPAGGRILDVGAGSQPYREACGHLRYVSQDMEKPSCFEEGFMSMREADYKEPDIVCDAVSIPEPDASFDAILCTEVLEHVSHPVRVLQEISRLVKSGGSLILTAPFALPVHGFSQHFFSGFSRGWYEKHLPDAGFDVEEITPNGNYFEHIGQEIRRLNGVAPLYCTGMKKGVKIFYGIYRIIVSIPILRMLKRYSVNDRGSSELFCCAWHVVARKR